MRDFKQYTSRKWALNLFYGALEMAKAGAGAGTGAGARVCRIVLKILYKSSLENLEISVAMTETTIIRGFIFENPMGYSENSDIEGRERLEGVTKRGDKGMLLVETSTAFD